MIARLLLLFVSILVSCTNTERLETKIAEQEGVINRLSELTNRLSKRLAAALAALEAAKQELQAAMRGDK